MIKPLNNLSNLFKFFAFVLDTSNSKLIALILRNLVRPINCNSYNIHSLLRLEVEVGMIATNTDLTVNHFHLVTVNNKMGNWFSSVSGDDEIDRLVKPIKEKVEETSRRNRSRTAKAKEICERKQREER